MLYDSSQREKGKKKKEKDRDLSERERERKREKKGYKEREREREREREMKKLSLAPPILLCSLFGFRYDFEEKNIKIHVACFRLARFFI
jgi:hypothetical protein